jgi:hypothetical protein
MLRVITKQLGNTVRLELHGLMGGEWVPLLEEHWRAIVRDLPHAQVTAVLSEVDFIDIEGERLIQRMAENGVRFIATGCMNRYVVEKRKAHTGETKGARS